jgi:hypothetical protein
MADKASVAAVRDVLERVSRVVEQTPDLTGREVRIRARLSRRACDEALDLLRRAGFVERQARSTEDTYRSALPYRAAAFGARADYGGSYSVGQGGDG